jgi:hypothetical protein
MAMVLLLTGCNLFSKWGVSRPQQASIPAETPTKTQLVNYLNANGQQIRALECTEVDLDCKYQHQSVGLRGRLDCQRPNNFRLTANIVGNRAVDIGSNDQEFWFWISKAEPPHLYHCSYADFNRGVKLPFPFQPEWIMEALGMSDYGPEGKYQLEVKPTTLELVENTQTPQGQPVRKVIVFNRADAVVQVPRYEVQDMNRRVICTAQITQVQRFGQVSVPKRLQLSWPAEKMELQLVLRDLILNPQIEGAVAQRLFTRPSLANVQAYDLARGLDPASGVRRAGALIQQ